MDATRLIHALERLEDNNVPDSEKVRLLTSLINDLLNRMSSLEADVDILTEELKHQ